MDSVKLKPCPFCGGSAEVSFRGKPENGGFFVVGCTTCRASMVGGYYRGSSDELYNQPYPLSEMVGAAKPIENWNRRVDYENS